MPDLAATLLTAALSLPQAAADVGVESPDDRRERLSVVADAIGQASQKATCSGAYARPASCSRRWPGSSSELGFLLLTQAFWESRLAWNVHAGFCNLQKLECDAYKDRFGVVRIRSTSIWQVQQNGLVSPETWRGLAGLELEQTREAAWTATRILAGARARCRTSGDWVTATISGYATGARCEWRGAPRRAKFFLMLQTKYAGG